MCCLQSVPVAISADINVIVNNVMDPCFLEDNTRLNFNQMSKNMLFICLSYLPKAICYGLLCSMYKFYDHSHQNFASH